MWRLCGFAIATHAASTMAQKPASATPAAKVENAGASSNGRTLVFGASYIGSNPVAPARWPQEP